jgi:hypothetical protein
MRDFFYFPDKGSLYESIVTIPTPQLPAEITRHAWPEGWIEPSATHRGA